MNSDSIGKFYSNLRKVYSFFDQINPYMGRKNTFNWEQAVYSDLGTSGHEFVRFTAILGRFYQTLGFVILACSFHRCSRFLGKRPPTPKSGSIRDQTKSEKNMVEQRFCFRHLARRGTTPSGELRNGWKQSSSVFIRVPMKMGMLKLLNR